MYWYDELKPVKLFETDNRDLHLAESNPTHSTIALK